MNTQEFTAVQKDDAKGLPEILRFCILSYIFVWATGFRSLRRGLKKRSWA